MPDPEPLPFYEFTNTRWDIHDGHESYLELESHPNGTFVFGGRIKGKRFADEDGEDFFLRDSDELIDFLEKHGLTKHLSNAKEISNGDDL